MTAAEKQIIIEKGSDFKITIVVEDKLGQAMDIEGRIPKMCLCYQKDGLVEYMTDSGIGAVDKSTIGVGINKQKTDAATGAITNKGTIELVIDSQITALLPTKLESDIKSVFATEYMYYYFIELNEVGDSKDVDNWRVLRGKCAVRV
jgi:hypothetical protein